METHSLTLPSLNKIHNYFIIADLHSKYMDHKSFDMFYRHLMSMPREARNIIILGDFLEFEMFFKGKGNSLYKRWIQSSHGVDEYFYPQYKEDIDFGNKIFDIFKDLGVESITYMMGNHSARIFEFLKDCPMSQRGLFSIHRDLKIKERGIKLIPYPDWLDLGNISLNHGYYHNVKYLNSHFADAMRSIAVGHMHKDRKESFKGRETRYRAYSVPCMCNLNPDYKQGKANDWNNGYSQILVESDGSFHFYTYDTTKTLILPDGVKLG